MEPKIITILKYLMFIIIPFLSVIYNIVFETAQGERTEEIAFGIIVGLVLDLIYAIVFLIMRKKERD